MVKSPKSGINACDNTLEQQEPTLEQSNVENHSNSSNTEGSTIVESDRSAASHSNDLITSEENSHSTVIPTNPHTYATHTLMSQVGYYYFTIDSTGYIASIQFSVNPVIDTHRCNQVFPIVNGIYMNSEVAYVVIKQPGFYQFSVNAHGNILSIHHWSNVPDGRCRNQELLAYVRDNLERTANRSRPHMRSVSHTCPEYSHNTFYDRTHTNGHFVSASFTSPIAYEGRLRATRQNNNMLGLNSLLNDRPPMPMSDRISLRPRIFMSQVEMEPYYSRSPPIRRGQHSNLNNIPSFSEDIIPASLPPFTFYDMPNMPDFNIPYIDIPYINISDINEFTTVQPYAEEGNNESCTVCIEHLKEGEMIRCLPCGHKFHPNCIEGWLESNGRCPNCRSDITKPKL